MSQIVPPASTETSRRFCGSCGAENPAANSFCASCGKPLGEAVQGQSATPTRGRKRSDLPPWQRAFCLVCLSVAGWLLFTTMQKTAPHPAPSHSSAANAEKLASERRLAQIMYEKFHDSGVEKVEVDGPIMSVHVTPEVYRAMFADRVEGNRIMRGWQTLIAQNYGTTGVGAVWLYSDGHKMAEADLHIWSGEIKVKWLDD